MKTYHECMPCFLRQAMEAAKLALADENTLKKIHDEVSLVLPELSMDLSPPEIARTVYGIVERFTGGKDAYKHLKEKSNSMAMELYPRLKKIVESSDDVLLSAVRLAVAGNVIDYGVPHSFDIEKEIEECLEKDFVIFDYKDFKSAVEKADRILYLLDNAGEIVFDKILIEKLNGKVTCAVRSRPIINDVTMDDARQVGLDIIAEVIPSGSEIPGTVLGECSKEFLEHYQKADVIISKGQGNFETLSEENKNIFFIFKAKCDIVARHVGCKRGDIILKHHNAL